MSQTKDEKKKGSSQAMPSLREIVPIGSKLGFGASEAYKVLRANLLFSVNSGERSQVIGLTSSARGEGKTTTSINLAYTFAEAGKRVLLVDGDLRLPQVAKTLKIYKRPGFSNYLAGMTGGKIPVQPSKLHENLSVISSGDIPPNPSELLGASTTASLIDELKKHYDCIIIDLPPVNIVSDAMVLSKICDGYLIVVRQDYTNKRELSDCIELMRGVNAKILGIVMTHSTVGEKGYYRKRRYGRGYSSKYGHRYGYKYGYKNESYGYENGYEKARTENDAQQKGSEAP